MERGLFDLLVFTRAIHFAATISVAGVVFFLAFVGEPAFRVADKNGPIPALVRSQLARIAWISLACVVVTGAVWLVLLAEQMSELSLAAAFSEGIVWSVLSDTDFGYDWIVRVVLTVLVAGILLPLDSTARITSSWKGASGVTLAAGLVGALGFAGHAAAGVGITGLVHLAADIAHLVAAAAWIGALVPLALLLHAAGHSPDQPSMAIARMATQRFSTLGVASVSTLLATGIINTWVLAGSVSALLGTDYGRLLLVKVALFLVMVATAAVNRLVLTPRLVAECNIAGGHEALRRLRNNSLIEAAIGAIVLVIVGVLGTLPPGLNDEV